MSAILVCKSYCTSEYHDHLSSCSRRTRTWWWRWCWKASTRATSTRCTASTSTRTATWATCAGLRADTTTRTAPVTARQRIQRGAPTTAYTQGRSNGPKGAGAKNFGSRLRRSLLFKPPVLCSIKASCQKTKKTHFHKNWLILLKNQWKMLFLKNVSITRVYTI